MALDKKIWFWKPRRKEKREACLPAKVEFIGFICHFSCPVLFWMSWLNIHNTVTTISDPPTDRLELKQNSSGVFVELASLGRH